MHNNVFNCDMHMHLDLSKDIENTIQYIEKNKSYTIAVTNLPDLYIKNVKKFANLKYIRFALGFHPELIHGYSKQLEIFKKEVKTTRYIGEIGLDKTDINNYDIQKKFFEIFVNECQKYGNKILSIHSRKSVDDVLGLINESFNGKIIMHWFSGNKKQLRECIKRGYYFSINESMIKSQNGKSIVLEIPEDKILIESDYPFIHGKSLYTLDFVSNIVKYLSILRNKSEEQIRIIIKSNLERLLK